MKQLVIGLGEIGTAIRKILECDGFDVKSPAEFVPYDVLHICFPYSEEFETEVIRYAQLTGAGMVIVHSTVPVGTCDAHGWVHSPVRGIHPDLELGMRTFVKFFGGNQAGAAAGLFLERSIKVHVSESARDTEALKLWDTTIYGLNIMIEKGIKAYCENNDLDFDLIYTYANITYNEGYRALGHPEYSKYVLKHKDGPIGGHCVIPNAELIDHPLAAILEHLHKQITDS